MRNSMRNSMASTRVSFSVFAGLMAGFLTGAPASAGEILRLKTGPVDPTVYATAQDDSSSRYFVIQFEGKVPKGAKARIERLGTQVVRYLPDDALLVEGPGATLAAARAWVPGVRAITHYRPEWKLSPELLRASGRSKRWILVATLQAKDAKAVRGELKRMRGVKAVFSSGRDTVIDAPASLAPLIARIEGVEWVETAPWVETFVAKLEDAPVPTPAPEKPALTGFESGTKLMGFDVAWERGFKGEGQIVAVADTGLDTGDPATLHPDFANFLSGHAIGLGGETWEDVQGHGTHVAGSVLGTGAASEGALKGGAHEAKLVMEGLWSPILDNLAPGTDFKRIIQPAYDDGARIHTNSWGNPRNLGGYDTMASRVDEYMWQNPDLLVLFAAGNSGEDADGDGRVDQGSVSSPGTAKNVLTVGASENTLPVGGIQKKHSELRDGAKKWGAEPLASDTLSNNADGIAAFSSRGPTRDGRMKPEIVAPGTNIVSARSKHPRATTLWGAYDENYVYAGGTSMATPLTAAAAAVAREYLVKERAISSPSAAVIKASLIHTAKDLYPGQYGTGPGQELQQPRPNAHEGYGRVDMDKLTSLRGEARIVDDLVGVGSGETKTLDFALPPSRKLRVTLVWTDAPALSSAERTLINDLDLSVAGPSGEAMASSDRVNNVEMIEHVAARGGSFEITVKGANVPQGVSEKQPYALIVSYE